MSGWKAKRFWKAATAEACEGGFTVRLDARAIKTPAKASLVVPTLALAQAIAAEWDAQQGAVQPATMPFTLGANSAIDKLSLQFDEVVALVAAYGDADLICYRATGPERLVAQQAAAWDPLLAWSAQALNAPLVATAGIVHIAQSPESLARLHAKVAAMTAFQLVAFHDLVAITGSLVLGFAIAQGHLTVDQAWHASRIDEDWQAALWGRDEDAAAMAARKHAGLRQADRFYQLCG